MNKKIWIVSIASTMLLASCWGNLTENNTWSIVNTDTPSINNETWENTNNVSNAKTIQINKSYSLWESTWSLVWSMVLENWIIKSVEFPWAQWPNKLFADNVWNQIIWKSIDWLKIDTISWASITSDAFNEFLNEISVK